MSVTKKERSSIHWRKLLLIGIASCFYYSGAVQFARWLTRRSKQRLIVLNYHRASGGDLRRHLLYLRRHYRLLHLENALEELYNICGQECRTRDRRTPLVMTFDDGYHDNYTVGFALARELRIPITIFLIPGYIESGEYFWWEEGARLVHRAQGDEVSLDGCSYCLKQSEGRKGLEQAIDTRLRHATSVAERELFLADVRKLLHVSSTGLADEEPALPLTWEEIRQMEESCYVSFGAHTMHHPILAYLTDPEEVHHEVQDCRTWLEQNLGHRIRAFAYPVGQRQHIHGTVVDAVKQAGYDWALTTSYGFNTPQSDPYLLRRIEVDVSQHWLVMAAEAAGLWGFFSRLRWLPLIRKYLTGSRS